MIMMVCRLLSWKSGIDDVRLLMLPMTREWQYAGWNGAGLFSQHAAFLSANVLRIVGHLRKSVIGRTKEVKM